MKDIKCIVAGSRTFTDYAVLKKKLDFLFSQYSPEEVTIISGTAMGADKMGERWAKEFGCKLIQCPANWDKYGKQAGYLRNTQMAEMATHCVVFVKDNSKGSMHMISIAAEKGLILRAYSV